MPKITRKGQVTIPKNIRDELGIRPGDSVKFRIVEGKCVVEKEVEENRMDRWIGYLGSEKRTDELIEELRGEIRDNE